MKLGWTVGIFHSIRMSGTELLHRRTVQCNQSVVSHDARLIDCFYQGYNSPSNVSQWICEMRFFPSKLLMKSFWIDYFNCMKDTCTKVYGKAQKARTFISANCLRFVQSFSRMSIRNNDLFRKKKN